MNLDIASGLPEIPSECPECGAESHSCRWNSCAIDSAGQPLLEIEVRRTRGKRRRFRTIVERSYACSGLIKAGYVDVSDPDAGGPYSYITVVRACPVVQQCKAQKWLNADSQ